MPRELALFTAVEGGVVEEGAGCAVPLRPLILLLVCCGLHSLAACAWDDRARGKDKTWLEMFDDFISSRGDVAATFRQNGNKLSVCL